MGLFRSITRLLTLLFILLISSWANCAAGQMVGDDLEFPYQAIVLSQSAPVRSGPGAVHYATAELKQGSTVEVYRHDPGGWCAIRPPRGSFSLVPADAINNIVDGVGEIASTGTQAWVGTQLGPVDQPLWQIKLKAGEAVELLGEANWPDPAGHSLVWYQIAPPAGEFRWIHIADIQLPPNDQLPEVSSSTNSIRTEPFPKKYDSAVRSASYQTEKLELNPPNSNVTDINQGWRQASRPIDKSGVSRTDDQAMGSNFSSLAIRDSDPPAISMNRSSLLNNNGNWSNERLASTRIDPRFDLEQLAPVNQNLNQISLPLGGYAGSQALTPRLTELELRLNQEMIKEPNQWRLIDLKTVAEAISASTNDSVEQLQAQRLLEKLENCRQIRSNYLNAFKINAGVSTNEPNDSTDAEFSLDTIYDAHGWLNELVRDGGRKRSTYVLQNDAGKITHHVSPGPGMNLTTYLKTKVGIIGPRGFHTELKLNHVTAERVIELKQR